MKLILYNLSAHSYNESHNQKGRVIATKKWQLLFFAFGEGVIGCLRK